MQNELLHIGHEVGNRLVALLYREVHQVNVAGELGDLPLQE